MKKLLLALAGTLCLGVLASCSNDAEEVVIRYADDMFSSDYECDYAGTVSGTVSYISTGSSYGSYAANVDTSALGRVAYRYDGDVKTNIQEYTLTVPVLLTWSLDGSMSKNFVSVRFAKVGSEYYAYAYSYGSELGEKIAVSGSPESSEFTLTGSIVSGNCVFSSVTFRRK